MKKFIDKLYKGSKKDFFSIVEQNLKTEKKQFIVTANPEAFMYGKRTESFKNLLLSNNTTVIADGIGIVKAAKKVDNLVYERIPGVELAEHLFSLADKYNKSIYLFGAKPEVLEALCQKLENEYKGLKIAGFCDGYKADKDKTFEEIKALSPDIILVALGIPAQEELIFKHLSGFEKGIFVGVGGSFDVLSGLKKRAPKIFIKCNLEWFYRIITEPKRIKRFYNNNVKFLLKVKK
ncbi:MAG: WecB/TagA/CpsF family glycosyltransferase [Clostridia bacterium]|nr:WecB/TagA/CpsF family glycosyltransferase [Clostridia bacterium]